MVRLWFAALTDFAAESERLKDVLSATERERAEGQRIAQRQMEFIIGRGLLRLLLARELNIAADCVPIAYTPHGKPLLVRAQDDPLHFNMSHSGGCVLYALSDDHPVGVDLEQIRPRRSAVAVARRLFTPAEQEFSFSAAPQDATDRFHALWVRKEAYAKAVGTGLSSTLRDFDMLRDDSTPACASSTCSPEPCDGRRNMSIRPDAGGLANASAATRLTIQARHSDPGQPLFAASRAIRVWRTSGDATEFVLRDLDIRAKDSAVRFAGAVCSPASVDPVHFGVLQPDVLQGLP